MAGCLRSKAASIKMPRWAPLQLLSYFVKCIICTVSKTLNKLMMMRHLLGCIIVYFLCLAIFQACILKSGLSTCIAPNAGLARSPVKGKYGFANIVILVLDLWCSRCCCPGPGESWGNLAFLPSSTKGESPSTKKC